MLSTTIRLTAATLALALCAMPVHAAKVSGTLDGFTVIRNQASDVDHALVRVNLQDGSRRVIDLGSRLSAEKLDLEQGDQIKVHGEKAKLDNRKVIKARRIKVDGQSFSLRSRGDRQAKRTRAQGTISGFKRIEHPKTRSENLWIRVSLQDGSSCIIDLGPLDKLSSLALDKGDQIKVDGHKCKYEGNKLIIARNVVVKDKDSDSVTRYIRRPVRKQAKQRDSQQQQSKRSRSGSDRQMSSGKKKHCPHCNKQISVRKQAISGSVADTKTVTLKANGEKHKLLKLELENGKSQIVNLSPKFGRNFLDIEQGDTIAVSGFSTKVKNKNVLVATNLIVLE